MPWAIGGDRHWISSSEGSSPVAMVLESDGQHERGSGS